MATDPEKPEPFDSHARRVLRSAQRAIARVIELVPGDVRKPNDLVSVLGVSKTLAWRVGNLVRQEDPLAVVGFLPRDGSIEVFIAAARERGVPDDALEAVRGALAEIDALARTHADDRPTLEMLVAGYLPGGGDEQTALVHRRNAFVSNSFLWGVQARAQYRNLIMAPTPGSPGYVDWATYGGYVHFRPLRPGVSWCVGQIGVYNQAASEWRAGSGQPRREPLDNAPTGENEASFIRAFSSTPLPTIQVVQSVPGMRLLKLVAGAVGNLGAMTWFFGDRVRGVPVREPSSGPAGQYLGAITHVRTPCEVVVCDLTMHRSIFGDAIPQAQVFGLMDSTGTTPASHGGQPLPMHLSVNAMGRGAAAARSHDVPQAEPLAAHVLERMEWSGDEFNVFRLRIEYPPAPALVAMHYPV